MRVLLILLVVLLAIPAIAAAESQGVTLSKQIYCDVKDLFAGKVGLLIGFCVALYGLMLIIQGKMMTGILFIVGGASVTFLPSLIESFMGGVGSVLDGAGISQRDSRGFGPGFSPSSKCANSGGGANMPNSQQQLW